MLMKTGLWHGSMSQGKMVQRTEVWSNIVCFMILQFWDCMIVQIMGRLIAFRYIVLFYTYSSDTKKKKKSIKKSYIYLLVKDAFLSYCSFHRATNACSLTIANPNYLMVRSGNVTSTSRTSDLHWPAANRT